MNMNLILNSIQNVYFPQHYDVAINCYLITEGYISNIYSLAFTDVLFPLLEYKLSCTFDIHFNNHPSLH